MRYPKEYEFFDIGYIIPTSIKKIERPVINGYKKEIYFNLMFNMDKRSMLYERQIYDIMSVLGDWGGVIQVIEVFGGLIVGSWSMFNYNIKLIKLLY